MNSVADFLKALKRAAPALAPKDDIPALSSFFFDGVSVRTYDDEVAITVPCDVDIEGGVNGALLLAWLGAVSTKEFTVDGGEPLAPPPRVVGYREIPPGAVVLTAGRSKITLPVISSELFAFQPEDEAPRVEIPAPINLIESMRQCAPYMGNDAAHPWRMGMTIRVTLDQTEVFATDNTGVAHGTCRLDVYGDEEEHYEVSIPSRFVQLLLDAVKVTGVDSLMLGDGWIEANLEDGSDLFSRTQAEVRVENFENPLAMVMEQCDSPVPIPDGFNELMGRTNKVLIAVKGESAKLKVGKSSLSVSTQGELLSLADTLRMVKSHESVSVLFMPSMMLPVLPYVTDFQLCDQAIAFMGQGFEAVIATVSAE